MPDIPKYEESLDKRILWSMASKEAERSRRTKSEIFLLSMDKRRSFWIRSRAVSVEWKGLFADWNGDNDGKVFGWSCNLVWIIRSMILEIKFRLEIVR